MSSTHCWVCLPLAQWHDLKRFASCDYDKVSRIAGHYQVTCLFNVTWFFPMHYRCWLHFVSGLPSAHQMNPNDRNLAGYPNRNAQVLQAMSTIWDRDRAFSNFDIWGALFLNANLILVGTLLYYILHFYNSTLQRCFNSYSYPDVILSKLCVAYSSCDSAWRSAICSERLESLPLKWTKVEARLICTNQ